MSKDQPSRYGANQIAEIANGIVDPVLARRAGINTALLGSWEDIVGESFADCTRPEKIVWPRRMHEDDPFEPATLVIACSGPAALHVQHETTEIISRVNAFLGFPAVGRIKIVQKPVSPQNTRQKPVLRALTAGEEKAVATKVEPIEDAGLRESLERLGRTIAGSRK